MNEQQIEQAENMLSYFGQHSEAMTYGPVAVHRKWWMEEAATLLRDLLPDWSAFKEG